jgi:hypothetical protein
MKLDCVLTAVNDNPLYIDFIPIFIKTWKKLYPTVDVKIILISNQIPEKFLQFKDHIILFEPIKNVLTSFTSQFIRLLYPCILNYKNGVLITDMDMLPMNRSYYTKNIEKYDDSKFIYYRENVCFNTKEIAMCYNVALPKTWSEIFNIKSLEDIKQRIILVNDNTKIIEGHGKQGWCTDQSTLYKDVNRWHKKTQNFVCLKESQTGFCRLDRPKFSKLDDKISKNITSGIYSDYHLHRPMNQYEKLNWDIHNLL